MDIPRFYPCFPHSFSGVKALFHVYFTLFPQTGSEAYTFPENVCSTPCGPLLSMHFPRTLRKIRKLYAGFKISGLPDPLHK